MTVLAEVTRAYTEETRQLDFRASKPLGVNDPDFKAAIMAIGQYNAFDPESVAEGLMAHNVEVTIARENSVALYVKSVPNSWASAALVMSTLRRLDADEVDLEVSGEIRAWWD